MDGPLRKYMSYFMWPSGKDREFISSSEIAPKGYLIAKPNDGVHDENSIHTSNPYNNALILFSYFQKQLFIV